MLRNFLLVSCVCVSSVLMAQKVITLKGSVDNPDKTNKMLVYRMDKQQKIDVAIFDLDDNNHFSQKIKVDVPGIYFLDCQKKQRLTFWAEDEDIDVQFHGKDTAIVKQKRMPVLVNPGIKNQVFSLYSYASFVYGNRQMDNMTERLKAEKSGFKEWSDICTERSAYNTKEFIDYVCFLVDTYPSVSSTIGMLPMIAKGENANFNKYLEKVTYYHAGHKALDNFIKINNEKISKRTSSLREKAPAFKLSNQSATKKIGPENYKGKLLLIDFWASWCGPCKKAIPHLKELYQKYKSQGFDILSVSIDKNHDAWRKSLHEENMPWEQVVSSNGGADVMSLYKFAIIPTLVLIDRDGNIVKNAISVSELEEYIKSNLKK